MRVFRWVWILMVLSGLNSPVFAQSISLGSDTNLSYCHDCLTLKANIHNPDAGTYDYDMVQIPFDTFDFSAGQVVFKNMASWNISGSKFRPWVLPFPFCFYDSSYVVCDIGNDGALFFDTTVWFISSLGVNSPLPNSNSWFWNTIMCAYSNFRTDTVNLRAAVHGVAPNRKFVVSWRNTCHNWPPFNLFCNNTFQIVLHESSHRIQTNIVYFNTYTVPNTNPPYTSAVHALIHRQGTPVKIYNNRTYGTVWTAINESVLFVPKDHKTYWYTGSGVLIDSLVDSLTVCPVTSGVHTYIAKTELYHCGGITEWVSDTIRIHKADSLQLSQLQVSDVLCKGTSTGGVQFIPSGGVPPLQYNLNGSNVAYTQLQQLSAGAYTLSVSDAQQCSTSITFDIKEPDSKVALVIDSLKHVSCHGEASGYLSVQAQGGSPPYSYQLSGGLPQLSSIFQNLGYGIYTVVVTDQHGCTASVKTQVHQPASGIQASFMVKQNSCSKHSEGSIQAIVSGGTPPYSYRWNTSPPIQLPVLSNLRDGIYVLDIQDAHGCRRADSVILASPDKGCGLFIPNAFTPNGDEQNDVFRVQTTCGDFSSYQIDIYNRWGNRVYSSKDSKVFWDGSYKGAPAASDMYKYQIRYRCTGNFEEKIETGDVYLMR